MLNLVLSLALFGGLIIAMQMGRRIGTRRLASDPHAGGAGIRAVEGTVFGLLGLLIAFTFSGAVTRFEARRHLITEEANAIGTAYLRIDALPSTTQPPLREAFRDYVDERIALFRAIGNEAQVQERAANVQVLQGRIWDLAVAACSVPTSSSATMLVLPAINQVIDISTTRATALESHPPPAIYFMMACLTFACSMLVGYSMAESKTRSWFHTVLYSLVIAITLYVILDIEHPRYGFIRIDSADHLLTDLWDQMK